MKKLSVNGHRGLFYLDTDGDPEDARIWSVINTRAGSITTAACGSLCVADFAGIGRAVRHIMGGAILFEPHSPDEFLRLVEPRKVGSFPTKCPFCGGSDVRAVNEITVRVTKNGRDPGDKSSMEMDEYQCHDACEGRSFWV